MSFASEVVYERFVETVGVHFKRPKSMTIASPPWLVNQAKRIAALAEAGILDTPSDEFFNGIVLRATQACNTPVGLISFVDDNRQWFKARIGFAPCETPLSQSVCKFALEHRGPLIIPDLTADPRTSDNTLVTEEPCIRFYAGAKITAPDGTPIGSLCVIDTVPRPEGLKPLQIAALEGLANECSFLMRKTSERDVHSSGSDQ